MRLNYAAAIPEPSSAALVVLGLVAVLAKRRRCAPRI
ncbi:PEP-CTERM sorting domain-containing protein [bacterium]|nr:PEP-CTERM sorting domain-containing protein [bacterium]